MRTHPPGRTPRALIVVALVVAAAVLAGCGGGSGESASVAEPSAPTGEAEVSGGAADDAVPPGSVAPAAAPVAGRQVIRTSTMTVVVEEGQFRVQYDRAARLATELGGFVAASDAQAAGDADVPQSGQLTMRVPVDRFDDARARLAALGTLKAESISGQDVTDQLVDLDARITTLRAQEEAYRALLARAQTISDIVQVQEELFAVRTQIEQLQAQQLSLQDRAALSTITVTIEEPAASGSDDEDGLDAAWARAVDAFTGVIGGLLVVAAALLPLLAVGAIVAVVARSLVRRRRRHSAATTADAGPPPPPPPVPPAAG